jgi:hypothetical protein
MSWTLHAIDLEFLNHKHNKKLLQGYIIKASQRLLLLELEKTLDKALV